MKYPIYILSSGRAKTATTMGLLQQEDIPYTLVIDPQDKSSYKKEFPDARFIILKKDFQGNAYARKAILKDAESLGVKFSWQLDDDLVAFLRRIDKKNIRCSPRKVMKPIEKYVDSYKNIGIAGPAYSLWAFGYTDPISMNRQSASCMLIRSDTGCQFDTSLSGCVDTDFHMQILSKKLCTVRFNQLLLTTMKTGTLRGGCTDSDYKNNGRAKACINFVKKWPGFKINQKDQSRIAPSQVWREFSQRPIER